MSRLRSWLDQGRPSFYGRLGTVGAVSGVAAWALAWGLSGLVGVSRPSLATLGSAVLRGTAVALVLAFLLDRLWSRNSSVRHRS